MKKYSFIFDTEVLKLEYKNQWKQAVDFLYHQWIEDPLNINNFLCLGTEIWYALIEMDHTRDLPMNFSNEERVLEEYLTKRLAQVTNYGFNYFNTNILFNVYFGYMIKTMPYLFVACDKYNDEWQIKGMEMINHAYLADTNNLLAKAIYYEHTAYENSKLYYDACKELWLKITPKEWGTSLVNQYFFRILWGHFFYTDAYV